MTSTGTASIRQRLLWVLALCALGCLLPAILLARNYLTEVSFAHREVAGVLPARNLLEVIQLTQQHRGLSAVWLGGDAAAADKRQAKKQQVDAAMAGFEAQLQADGAADSRLSKEWQRDVAAWRSLEQAVSAKQVSGAQSSSQHTALLASMLHTLNAVGDHWWLSFDPVPGTYFLAISALQQAPAMIELMGQTRARGATLLSTKAALDPVDKARFEALQTRMRAAYEDMRLTLEKSVAANDVSKAAVQSASQALDDLGQAGIKLAQDHLLTPEVPSLAPGEYVAQTTQVIDGMYVALSSILDVLDAELRADAAHKLRSSLFMLAAVLLAFAAAVAFTLRASQRIRTDLGAEPDQLRAVAQAVCDGDLSARVAVHGGDQGSVAAALNSMQLRLTDLVSQVRQNAESVATASTQIAQGNQELSQRTEQQASSLQMTAATMEQLGTTVQHNAEHSKQADTLARAASQVAVQGGEAVAQVVETMKGINESSRRIVDIVGVIDGIAFQTNILALNAAVEAARAGEQGRGFAVVATEVRALAKRSADAAREIKGLIGASVERVESGSAQVRQAGSTIEAVVEAIRRVSGIVGEISGASSQQSAGVQQVGHAVNELDHGTQQNAALVEETAAAAMSLQQQAEALVQTVSVFKLARA